MVAVLGDENTVTNIGLVLNFGSRVMNYDFAPDQSCFYLILSMGTIFKSIFIEIRLPVYQYQQVDPSDLEVCG